MIDRGQDGDSDRRCPGWPRGAPRARSGPRE